MAKDDERRVRRAAAEWRGDAGAIAARRPKKADAAMTGANDNLAPVLEQSRAWGAWDLAALWVGLVVCVPTWTLVTGLVTAGMNVGLIHSTSLPSSALAFRAVTRGLLAAEGAGATSVDTGVTLRSFDAGAEAEASPPGTPISPPNRASSAGKLGRRAMAAATTGAIS